MVQTTGRKKGHPKDETKKSAKTRIKQLARKVTKEKNTAEAGETTSN